MSNHSTKLAIALPLVALAIFATGASRASAQTANNTQSVAQCMAIGGARALTAQLTQKAIYTGIVAAATALSASAETTASAINVPVARPAGAVTSGVTAGAATASSIWDNYFKPYLNQMAVVTGQCLLQELTNSTVTWIQGGFHGSPAFSIDPKQVFLGVQDTVARQLANQVLDSQTTFFPSIGKYSLSNAIQLSTRVNADGKFAASLATTFPPSINQQAYYQNFYQGGWDAYALSLSDNNNSFGSMLIIGDELAARQAEAQSIRQQQLSWSNGFTDLVDTTKCTYPKDKDGKDIYSLDANGNLDPKVYTDPATKAEIQKQFCLITTPGKIISDQLSKTLGTDMDRLGLANDMDKIITALIMRLMTDTVHHVF